MGYFPFFMDLSGRKGLIVGGGMVALRKAEKLMPYGPKLTVAAPEIDSAFCGLPDVTVLKQPFVPELLEDMFFVIAATDDPAVNHEISRLCGERAIPVNVVDDPDACSFLFPALVKRGDLSVGISTGGASPTAAVWVKEELEAFLPNHFEEILAFLNGVRPLVKESVPQERRSAVLAALFRACMERNRPLEEMELRALLEVEA